MTETTSEHPSTLTRRTVIYVHGKRSKPAAESLAELVETALQTGVERDFPELAERFAAIDKRLAYYGQHVNALLAAKGEHYDEKLDIGDCENALQHLRNYDRRKKFSLSNYDRLPGKSAIPEFAADVAAPLLGSLGLSKPLIAKAAPEFDDYWQPDSEFAAAVRDEVRKVIAASLAAGDQVMVISHGTGCIVTWDVLWQLSHGDSADDVAGRKVDTWVTLGAPLGDSMVRRRLLGADCKGRECFPENIVSWHNVSAEDDWISHDNTLADDYRQMLQQKQISAIRDYRVYNLAVRYGKSDPHSWLGYLVHPRMAQIIADWLDRPQTQAGVRHIY